MVNSSSDSTIDSLPRANRFGLLVRNRLSGWIALIVVIVGVSLTGLRTYRQYAPPARIFDHSHTGMSDFHNGAFFPALAFREGVNPYSNEICDAYPTPRSVPPYSPIVFMLYAPLTFLSIEQADVAFFAINVLLVALIAYFGISMAGAKFEWAPWLWGIALLVYSRPGHITLFTGYFTAQLVIGTLLAVHFAKTRPVLAGLGMLLASGKPTYILPLTIMMLFRRDYKAVAIGLVFCVLAAAIGLGWIASHSNLEQVVQGVRQAQSAHHEDPSEDPVNTWTRLDAVGVVSKIMEWKPGNKTYFAAMLALLVMPGITVWRCTRNEGNTGATSLSGMIICLAMLVSIYHQSYDYLLMGVAWFGVAFFSAASGELKSYERFTLIALLGIPAVNYLSTSRFRDVMGFDDQSGMWTVITSVNGVCLLAAMLILIAVAWRTSKQNLVCQSNSN